MTVERRESLVLLAGSGVTAGLSFVFVAYASRVLGPERAADFLAAIFLSTAVATAATPVNATATRFTGLYAARGDLSAVRRLGVAMARAVTLWGGLALVVALALIEPLHRLLDFGSAAAPALALGLAFLAILAGVPQGLLRGLRRFGALGLNTAADAATRLLAAVALLAWLPATPPALVAYGLGLGLAVGLGAWQLRDLPAAETRRRLAAAEIGRFTLPMFVLAGTSAGFANLDVLLVKGLLTRPEAGVYAAAAALGRGFSLLLTPFRLHALPLLVALGAEGQPLGPALGRLSGRFLALAAAPLAVLAIWPGPVVDLVYGSAFSEATELILPLALVALVGALTTLTCQGFVSMARFRFLYPYAAALAVEALCIALWHGSLLGIAYTVLGVQTAALVVMWALFRGSSKGGGPQAPG